MQNFVQNLMVQSVFQSDSSCKSYVNFSDTMFLAGYGTKTATPTSTTHNLVTKYRIDLVQQPF